MNAITYNNSYEKLSLGDGNYLTLLDKNNSKILQFEKNNYLLKSSSGNLEVNLNNGKIISKDLIIFWNNKSGKKSFGFFLLLFINEAIIPFVLNKFNSILSSACNWEVAMIYYDT